MRLACLNAIKCIPYSPGDPIHVDISVTTRFWIALHDPEKVSDVYILSCIVLAANSL